MTFPLQIAERDELLAKAESIRSILEADAEQNEADRTLAKTSVDALYDTGLLNMCVPRSLGGLEADPVTQTEVYELVTSMDASAGWCLVIGATSAGMLGNMISDTALDQVFKHGRIPKASGSVFPSGIAEKVEGGYQVNGRWAFGSAIHHADWVSTGALIGKDGKPIRNDKGMPEVCSICVPIKDVVIEDNWHSNGLRGSGSSHYQINNVFVPDAYMLRRTNAHRGGKLFDIPTFGYVAGCHAGFALGVAKRSLAEIVAMATDKRRKLSGIHLADRGAFHKELGVISCKLNGARLLSLDILNQLWQATNREERMSLVQWGECRAAMTYVTEVAAEVATFCYRYGAGASLYQPHPLQRYLRDIYTGIQHGVVSEENYEALGKALIGKGKWEPIIGGGPR
ncbi:MAG: acyl-CoA dehydrogenase family protein [Pseudomonadales bacterium]|nr:acyl-CoA dehydrogenase family protein [Pseudomonadales bacterium]